jgi:hypothetical protein
MLIPPLCWLWFCDWDLQDSTTLVLIASSIAGGLVAWLLLATVVRRVARAQA